VIFQKNVDLKNYTTLKVGGPAELFVSVTSESELEKVMVECTDKKVTILGGGSNVLIPDKGLSGVVVKNDIKGFEVEPIDTKILVRVGAGEIFDQVIKKCAENGYWGLENLSSIPGSVGATPVQNVGAYGVEVADVIASVKVYDNASKKFLTLSNEDCRFAYRDSLFKKDEGKNLIVCEVVFELSLNPKPNLAYKDLEKYFINQSDPELFSIREAVIEIRKQKFPDWNLVGTAGSFFKNPIVRRVTYERLREQYPGLPGFDVSDIDVKIPLGWVLDKVCNLRGYQVDQVGTYKDQALVIVNYGNASATDIKNFAEEIISKIFDKTGLRIEWEVTQLK
jgi:UDP-N-acetylmuramate dehydrogenase